MTEKVLIIGSGPAGLTAAIYAARANLSPLLMEGFQSGGVAGGQLMTTDIVENFPGFPQGVNGIDLMTNMREQAVRFSTRMIAEDVEAADLKSRPFRVFTSGMKEFTAHSLIVATGAVARRLPLESEKKFWQKGVSACAVCDGGLPLFRNKPLAVIGGGDTACEEALHLSQFGSKIHLIHRRGELRASKIMRERVQNHPKIEILWHKTVKEFMGENLIQALRLKDVRTGEISLIPVAGAFEAIGHQVNVDFLHGQLAITETGYIATQGSSTVTSVEGVFAAGDVTDDRYRQAITAAGMGCRAAIDAESWLHEKGLAG